MSMSDTAERKFAAGLRGGRFDGASGPTDEQLEKLRHLFAAGLPLETIAQKLDLRIGAVSGAIERLGLTRGSVRANGSKATPPPAISAAVALTPAADWIDLGSTETGAPFGLSLDRLVAGRLLVQGMSGAGKSWLLRRLVEALAGRIAACVIDPEGEFGSLSDLGFLAVDAARLDRTAVATLAGRAREHRLSLTLDLSQLDRADQMGYAASFFNALVEAPKEHWTPLVVLVDEAHLIAPWGTEVPNSIRKESVAALAALASRGRKRGLVAVIATQRLVKLSKSVASECHNMMVGLNTLDLDIKRAAETIGWTARRASDRLPLLSAGEFVAVGPAFLPSTPLVANIGPVKTRHIGATPEIVQPAALDQARTARTLDLAELEAASEREEQEPAEAEEVTLPTGIRAVRQFLRDPSAALAVRVLAALRPLAPHGAWMLDLAQNLEISAVELAQAIALLDQWACVEIEGDREVRMVRAAKPLWSSGDK